MKKLLFLLFLVSALQGLSQTEVGVQLYSFRNQFKEDVPGTLAKISAMGIRFAEGGDSYGLPAADFKKMLDQHNIKVVSIGADYNELSGNIPAIIEKARLYGASYVVCFWIPHQGDQLTLEEAEAAIRVFNSAGEKLAAAGLRFAYHPHGYEFAKEGKGTIFDRLMAGTDPRYCNFEMDVYWIKQAGADPIGLLKKYPSRFILMHLKDRKPGTADTNNGHADVETNVILGQGDVGIAALVKEARKLKMKYLFIEDESSRSMTQVPESLKFLGQ
jgi:sugar phosphate isomerase/epimerase